MTEATALAVRESTAVTETAATAMAAREKAAIEARALVALRQPRDIDMFRTALLKACKRPRFAGVAKYAKPVAGQQIIGPSVRFAEECARHYHNLTVESFVTFDDDERRTVRVIATDLEANIHVMQDVHLQKTVERKKPKPGDEVLRQRLNSRGEPVSVIRATEDDLLTKQNAQVSKARRNLILQLIPSDIVEEAMEQVDETQQSEDAKDPDAARKKVLDAFFGIGVTPEQIADLLGHPTAIINPAEMVLLRRIWTAMKDEGATWADVVESRQRKSEAASAKSSTAEAVRAAAKRAERAERSAEDAALDAELAKEG